MKGFIRGPSKGSIQFRDVRTHIFRLLGPKTILYKALDYFGGSLLYFLYNIPPNPTLIIKAFGAIFDPWGWTTTEARGSK